MKQVFWYCSSVFSIIFCLYWGYLLKKIKLLLMKINLFFIKSKLYGVFRGFNETPKYHFTLKRITNIYGLWTFKYDRKKLLFFSTKTRKWFGLEETILKVLIIGLGYRSGVDIWLVFKKSICSSFNIIKHKYSHNRQLISNNLLQN